MRTKQAGGQFRGGSEEGGDGGCRAECPLEGGARQEWRRIGLLDGLPVTLKTGREVCDQCSREPKHKMT